MSAPNGVRVSARDEATITGLVGITHDRIDAALAEVRRVIDDGETERAGEYFTEIERELRQHIRVEEEVLFPLFDARTGVVGPTAVMLDEHRRIERWMTRIRAALDGGRGAEADESLEQIVALLRQHHLKEEKILYPKTDAAITAKERAELVERLRNSLTRDTP